MKKTTLKQAPSMELLAYKNIGRQLEKRRAADDAADRKRDEQKRDAGPTTLHEAAARFKRLLARSSEPPVRRKVSVSIARKVVR